MLTSSHPAPEMPALGRLHLHCHSCGDTNRHAISERSNRTSECETDNLDLRTPLFSVFEDHNHSNPGPKSKDEACPYPAFACFFCYHASSLFLQPPVPSCFQYNFLVRATLILDAPSKSRSGKSWKSTPI